MDLLQYLVSKDGDVESLSYGGFKPVHHACNWSREAALKELMVAGCNVTSVDEAGNTGMHWAAARYSKIVSLLQDFGPAFFVRMRGCACLPGVF